VVSASLSFVGGAMVGQPISKLATAARVDGWWCSVS